MATILLSAVGASVGASLGGSVLGISAAVIGRAAGGVAGKLIDNRLLGTGAKAVESGRVEQLRIMGSGEGQSMARIFGRVRVAGHVIWSSRFYEHVATSGSGKGMAVGPTRRDYSYSISLAVALCEGEVSRIGRIWADGNLLDTSGMSWRLHKGGESQMPDPAIEAVEGAGLAPAYRGTAYVVFEDLDLTQFGNRIPQFNFEVMRATKSDTPAPRDLIEAVALIPGTGEYALATEPVYFEESRGTSRSANSNGDTGDVDFTASLEQMAGELPNVGATSLVVSWFGNDLRCDTCEIYPAVEQNAVDGTPMPWRVNGMDRAAARLISQTDGRPNYGGTPSDTSVLQAIAALKDAGKAVTFYPFVLMDIAPGNTLTDPYSGTAGQPVFPWRGRITTSLAAGQAGSPQMNAQAADEVAAFFGTAQAGDFTVSNGQVSYSGPAEFSYRRFILHYAHLCAAAGGVDAFLIGSELRGLTRIRAGQNDFPAVDALRVLAADVRAILGAGVKISYAADWSEYGAYAAGDGDVLFHLDPLWADDTIDFIGIDNYLPLSDWRDADGHADAQAGSIYALDYLQGNIEGGEYFDWYYANDEARKLQRRRPIEDGAYGEPWIYRAKDIRSWWRLPHSNRLNGVRQSGYTDWVPQSKPIWFTELGCAAIDKGTNQPNVFYDAKSSESAVPYFSSGAPDDAIQAAYIQAMLGYWGDAANNPQSPHYEGRMLDMGRAHLWAWDTRPWPAFPARQSLWSDAENHARGHWLNGRVGQVSLAGVVAEICAYAGLSAVDISALHGAVQGYILQGDESARQALQPLMLAYGFDAIERAGGFAFATRDGRALLTLEAEGMALGEDTPSPVQFQRGEDAPARVRISFFEGDNAYQSGAAEAARPDAQSPEVSHSGLGLVLGMGQAQAIAERWLNEARVARDAVQFALPPSQLALDAGDVVRLRHSGETAAYRIDRIEDMGERRMSAVRVEPGVYKAAPMTLRRHERGGISTAGPVYGMLLDLPLLAESDVPHAPYMGVAAAPWPGAVSVLSAAASSGFELVGTLTRSMVLGKTQQDLPAAMPGRWQRGAGLEVKLDLGQLQSRAPLDVLGGANAAALRLGDAWEIIQFETAELIAPLTYRLDGLLRGQRGTDALMPEIVPAGADFVLLDGAQAQPDFSLGQIGAARQYRIGPANRPYDDMRYHAFEATHEGAGLRPYAPVHLRASKQGSDLVLSWIRRGRLDNDSWLAGDIPLGEEAEAYRLRIFVGGELRRDVALSSPAFTYSAAAMAADGATPSFEFEIAQLSASIGAGLVARKTVYV
ncbi:glycoside hydrolase TIM-barrel-like domain-containing protein [Abyssibius alkaniclasticus]|uniref:baseplate multidomain protein megatron n=1 Tax=Abyssibius alkaniclasticus TaxID=2881234 RepID=UPI0023639420|nr:glycoside hydrolase TIM-barrel-like domain-containing protein [Abyssibius alkaniclasticus]UPH70900.1 glycoside hydrolase TIM-barrel-like domain-containing protein [Abyssibius alkaniclasticus]